MPNCANFSFYFLQRPGQLSKWQMCGEVFAKDSQSTSSYRLSLHHPPNMVIGLLILTSIPTVTGVAQAMSAQKTTEQRQKDERRMKKFHIDVHCEADGSRINEIHGKRLVLRDDRVWIGAHEASNPCKEGYVAEAFYIEYPDKEVSGLKCSLDSQRINLLLTTTRTAERPCRAWARQSGPSRSSTFELDICG